MAIGKAASRRVSKTDCYGCRHDSINNAVNILFLLLLRMNHATDQGQDSSDVRPNSRANWIGTDLLYFPAEVRGFQAKNSVDSTASTFRQFKLWQVSTTEWHIRYIVQFTQARRQRLSCVYIIANALRHSTVNSWVMAISVTAVRTGRVGSRSQKWHTHEALIYRSVQGALKQFKWQKNFMLAHL